MKDMREFIGKSWTIEVKGNHSYVTDAISAQSMSTTDPNCHAPSGDRTSLYYVLCKLRNLTRRAERAIEDAPVAVIPATGPSRPIPATLTTVLHTYRFDLATAEARDAYDKLRLSLKALGLRKLHVAVATTYALGVLDGRDILLDTDYLFSDQWNVIRPAARLFDWFEAAWPNQDIKEGYWLEQTDDMRNARRVRHTCGYCGYQVDVFTPTETMWCDQCLDGEHLQEEDLPLLRLRSVAATRSRDDECPAPAWLAEQYRARQRAARDVRLREMKDVKLAKCRQGLQDAQMEYDGFEWLVEHDLPFDDIIFYPHTQTFRWGWGKPIPQAKADKIKARLEADAFPFKYEITTL